MFLYLSILHRYLFLQFLTPRYFYLSQLVSHWKVFCSGSLLSIFVRHCIVYSLFLFCPTKVPMIGSSIKGYLHYRWRRERVKKVLIVSNMLKLCEYNMHVSVYWTLNFGHNTRLDVNCNTTLYLRGSRICVLLIQVPALRFKDWG